MPRCASESCAGGRSDAVAGGSGLTLGARWFCSHACVDGMVQRLLEEAASTSPAASASSAASLRHLRLGMLLRSHGALSPDQLHAALEEQRHSGLRLGAQVRARFGIDSGRVLHALAAQAGTRYLTAIDVATVYDAPGRLPREVMTALGLVPFAPPDRQARVRVASRAPISWPSITVLRQLTGWTPEPYLVDDETWELLFDKYGVNAGGAATSDRVAGESHVRDASWQAVNTSH